ncbi:MAG: hypothetical protein EB084_18190 [Proteobacteria bacterium]|nr:hypothetical protein [Pseudomonadota bacterium]
MRATVARRLQFLLALTALAVSVFPRHAAASTPELAAFTPLDGTFRDVRSLSRYERAVLLTQRLRTLGPEASDVVKRQEAELTPELTSLGSPLSPSHALPEAQPFSPVRVFSESTDWGLPRSSRWTLARARAVDAFWSHLSAPALRDTDNWEPSGRPRITPPQTDDAAFLISWRTSTPASEVLTSSPVSALPPVVRIALHEGLALDFAFTPRESPARAVASIHENLAPQTAPLLLSRPSALSAATFARLGLNAPAAALPASPLLQPISPVALTSKRAPLQTRMLTTSAVAPLTTLPESPASEKAWGVSLSAPSPPGLAPMGAVAPPAGDATATLLGPVSAGAAVSTTYTHVSATASYRLPVRGLDLAINVNEWRYAGSASGAANGATLDRLHLQDARLNLSYNVNPTLSLQGGYLYSRASGTVASGIDTGATSLSQDRGAPYLGFDYKLSTDTRWKVNIRFYNTPFDVTTTGTPRNGLNLTEPQVTSEVKVRF